VDYLAIDDPEADLAEAIGTGLAEGAEAADVALLGGETAVMPEVIQGFDLAGACVGLAPQDAVFEGTTEPGHALVGVPSSGIHSNGLTLARTAVTREHDYTDPFPHDEERTIGEVLLEPTRLYTDLLEPMREHEVVAAAHITGGGWTNLERLGDYRYEIEDPLPAQPVFEFVQDCGGVSDEEMHRTFNMGTGFVAAVPAENAEALAGAVDGRVIGRVEDGSGVSIRGLEL
jgi:phosphoribosylformylglycinamidine cyclo-ligase